MTQPHEKKFDETLRRLMSAPPKPQEDMKKGREPKPAPDQSNVNSKTDT